MNTFIQTMFQSVKCLPIVTIQNPDDAVPLARALSEGGIKNIEITLRTDYAIESIRRIKAELPEMIVGAGTVFTAEQVGQSQRAGASYIVSPGYGAIVHQTCDRLNIGYLPGAVTPTEIEALVDQGFKYAKFFPAEASGGVKMLRAVMPVFANIRFCATGGVSLENMQEYLAVPNCAAVGLSAIAPQKMIEAKDWAGITELAKKAVELAQSKS